MLSWIIETTGEHHVTDIYIQESAMFVNLRHAALKCAPNRNLFFNASVLVHLSERAVEQKMNCSF